MRLRVVYHRLADLVADHEQQLSHGGLLVRVVPPGLAQFETIELELVAAGASVRVPAQVMQVFDGVGVAVTIIARTDGEARGPNADASVSDTVAQTGARRDPFAALLASARATPDFDGADAEHSVASDDEPLRAPSRLKSVDAAIATKIKQALYGDRDARAAIMRELNPALHAHVLRNPGLQLDEVSAIARSRTVSPELLKSIAERREWAQRPDIAIALVRNPKIPVPIAIRLLDHVSAAELRQLAKDPRARTALQSAARKKIIG